MKRTFLRCEFMRNSTYGVIEVQAVSLLPRIEVHLRISFLASRLNVKDHNMSLVDNTFTIFALKCLFEYFEEKAPIDEKNWMHWLCLLVARIIKPQAVSKTRLIFFAAYRLSTSKSCLGNKCTLFQLWSGMLILIICLVYRRE